MVGLTTSRKPPVASVVTDGSDANAVAPSGSADRVTAWPASGAPERVTLPYSVEVRPKTTVLGVATRVSVAGAGGGGGVGTALSNVTLNEPILGVTCPSAD